VDTQNAFPIGSWHGVQGTWLVALLPYVDQMSMSKAYVGSGSVFTFRVAGGIRYGSTPNLPVVRKQLPVYSCPSDSVTADANVILGITFHNYVANYGNTTRGRLSPYGVTSSGAANNWGGAPFIEYIAPNTGGWANFYSWIHTDLSKPKYVVKLSEVRDGTSTTLAFSECLQATGGDLSGFNWWGGGCHFETLLPPNTRQPDVVEQSCATGAARIPTNPPCVVRAGASGNVVTTGAETHAARSRHQGGVHCSMADGSTRFVSNSVALDIWRALGSAAGRESVSLQ